MKYHFDLIKSNRKSISLEIRPDGKLTVRVPSRMSIREINKYVEEKSEWIEKALEKYRLPDEEKENVLTETELRTLAEKARETIPPKVKKYADLMNVTYGNITIRSQHTRWGSCTSKGNLNFNCLLMMTPEKVIDSVIVHELCHRKEMNHSNRFYDEIYKVFPDYDECDKWLKSNGYKLMRQLPKK